MLSSAGIQPGIANHSSSRLFPARNQIRFLKNRTISLYPNKAQRKPFTISSSLTQESTIVEEKKKVGVVVKAMERPRLVLKFMWMEKNIGIAVDQVIAGGGGTIPVSPYYFWPRKDAWEELKLMLESKHWISYKQMVLLLNQATEIINLWQQSGGGTT